MLITSGQNYKYLDHDNRAPSLVEVGCHFRQQHAEPAVHMLQVIWIKGPQLHLPATHNLRDESCQPIIHASPEETSHLELPTTQLMARCLVFPCFHNMLLQHS